MNRRAILAILTGSATSLYSRFVWAANGDQGLPAAARSPWAPNETGGPREKVPKVTPGFPDLKLVGHDRQVRSIAYSRGAYRVTTADGKNTEFLEADLRFKIDSSDLGPRTGAPIILPAGTEGDRVSIFFASPREISGFIDRDGL